MPAHVLVLDAAEGIGPWARDALSHAGLACALVKEDVEALRSVDAQWPALVVVPLDEVQRWSWCPSTRWNAGRQSSAA